LLLETQYPSPLHALLYELKVRIQKVPLIILLRLRLSRLDIVLSRNAEFLLRLARRNITIKPIETGLIDSKAVRIFLSRYQIEPPLVALRQNVSGDIARILVRIACDRDHIVATRDFVVLEPVVASGGDARAEFIDVFDGVHVWRDWVVDVNYQNLPVGLTAVVGCDAA
jgi:hypothetical protein